MARGPGKQQATCTCSSNQLAIQQEQATVQQQQLQEQHQLTAAVDSKGSTVYLLKRLSRARRLGGIG
jgi:hypothetical protein